MQIVLFEPEIPPNTGNIARLCAAYNIPLNLIAPLGFKLEDRYLKRAGLDYWPHVQLKLWENWNAFITSTRQENSPRLVMLSTKAAQMLQNFVFQPSDLLVFGPETRGLPAEILAQSAFKIRIPMIKMEAGGARSLNLSTAVGITLFTALNNCGLLQLYS